MKNNQFNFATNPTLTLSKRWGRFKRDRDMPFFWFGVVIWGCLALFMTGVGLGVYERNGWRQTITTELCPPSEYVVRSFDKGSDFLCIDKETGIVYYPEYIKK